MNADSLETVRLKRKNNGNAMLTAFAAFLCVLLFLRMELYLGAVFTVGYTVQIIIGVLTVIFALAASVLAVINGALKGELAIFSAALVFFLFGWISTLLNLGHQTNIIETIYAQSLWFAALAVFSFYLPRCTEKSAGTLEKILGVAFFVLAARYLLWYLFGAEAVDGSVNCVYYALMLLPLAFSGKKLSYSLFIIIFLFANTVLSGKRTAFLTLALAVIVTLLAEMLVRKRKRAFALVMIAGAAIVVAYFLLAQYFDVVIFDRLGDMAEDGGSGRTEIYADVIEAFFSSSFIDQIFGFGFNGVYLTGASATSAHNDFLEVLYDFGYVGLIAYLVFVWRLVVQCYRLYKVRSRYAAANLCALVVFFVMSSTSHLILYPTYMIFLLIFFAIGRWELDGRKAGAEE